MDFFFGQETLTTMQWILRAIIAYFFMLLITRVMGQRSISQLSFLDFTMALIIGNIISHPLSDERRGLKGPIITMIVLAILYLLSIFLTLKWAKLRRFVFPEAFPLIKNGQILSENLRKARISIDDLLSAARKDKIEDIRKVALALWEQDGHISFFLLPSHQTVTRSDVNLVPQPFDLPKIIVREGVIDNEELKQVGKEENWLIHTLKKTHQVEVSDVLLATVDKNGELTIFLYK
ncbi:DUF421 domain-containing protein [Bacillus sp. Bva_UNVM-123]|uniref:DUF421 domain-containing protein n=1 Tax=Bacillus sp. Bva_UNVM-123 TaxID=2829798 RepID=UPI00391F2DD4